jgi:hypothetical protein
MYGNYITEVTGSIRKLKPLQMAILKELVEVAGILRKSIYALGGRRAIQLCHGDINQELYQQAVLAKINSLLISSSDSGCARLAINDCQNSYSW